MVWMVLMREFRHLHPRSRGPLQTVSEAHKDLKSQRVAAGHVAIIRHEGQKETPLPRHRRKAGLHSQRRKYLSSKTKC